MPITCPVCNAANEQPPACRRCRADLSMLFALEARREALLAGAARDTREGRFAQAAGRLDEAERLREGDDIGRARAVVLLMAGDFAGAWGAYRAATSKQAGD